jgi:uroporphyrinogen-III synthase
MAADLLILRPQPGADATARRAVALGLKAVVAPLFDVEPVAWQAPDIADFDAVALTSANAARFAGPELSALLHLPCFAVGHATADAARAAGFNRIVAGDGDASTLAQLAARQGAKSVVHLRGQDSKGLYHPEVQVIERVVYRSQPIGTLPDVARDAASAGAVALIHSPRAGATFGALLGEAGIARALVRLAAISPAALRAAGPGWGASLSAATPQDDALLAVAAKLCNMSPGEGTTS